MPLIGFFVESSTDSPSDPTVMLSPRSLISGKLMYLNGSGLEGIERKMLERSDIEFREARAGGILSGIDVCGCGEQDPPVGVAAEHGAVAV